MSKKSLVLTLIAHKGYTHHSSTCDAIQQETELLFSAISETYLPLLNMFERLDLDSIPFKISMVITPTLCAQLSDFGVQERYVSWLDKLIVLGEKQLSLTNDSNQKEQILFCLERFKKNKKDFTEVYKSDLLSAFRYYATRGSLELLATTATNVFLPHYIDMEEAVNAQFEAGLQSHRHFFGVVPDGFWLPSMAYTNGIEKFIKNYGFSYSILDTHGILFANPLPSKGIFSPVKCKNGLALFPRDFSAENIICGENGFIHHPVYRNQNKDWVFEASAEVLEGFLSTDEARVTSGFKFWNNNHCEDNWYNLSAANEQVKIDANIFVNEYVKKMQQAQVMLETDNLSLVCAVDANVFGQKWFEGISWLEEVIRLIAKNEELKLNFCSKLLKDKNDFQEIEPYLSANIGTGYGENTLDTSNSWMLAYTRKACQRMIYLANRFSDDTGLKARALNLAAKEVLLSQSMDWSCMLHDKIFADYAESQFRKNILSFTTVYDSLGSSVISTEWLTRMEQEHPLFHCINYHSFSTKK